MPCFEKYMSYRRYDKIRWNARCSCSFCCISRKSSALIGRWRYKTVYATQCAWLEKWNCGVVYPGNKNDFLKTP